MSERPRLRELADRMGILPFYTSASDGKRRWTSDATRVRILAAMGLEAATEAAAGDTQRAIETQERARLLEPTRVATAAKDFGAVAVQLPAEADGKLEWRLTLESEDGHHEQAEGFVADPGHRRRFKLAIPGPPLSPGIHSLQLAIQRSGHCHEARQMLIVAPPRCTTVADRIGERRGFGIWSNLYTVRSQRAWGVGDVGDLRTLIEFAARHGAAFIGVNPLHALWNRGEHVSPYAPISRLHRNLIYLEINAIPEVDTCPTAREHMASPELASELEQLRAAGDLDYQRLLNAKRNVLILLHEDFAGRHRDADTSRGRAYRHYLEREGPSLLDFATFLALAEHLEPSVEEPDWRRWPLQYRNPESPAVTRFRHEHSEAVSFHCWIQFELDRQLEDAAAMARGLGLPIGVYADLAIGSSASGSDTWAFPDLFAEGVNVGAPPDDFAKEGQNWNFPPIDPHRLRQQAYAYWLRLLRSAFAHTGALRIDHVMGLFRLFWIPEGSPASEGAYVRYPARDLLGILALESQRAQALVVGEDLGTVPRGLGTQLARWGILSSRVLYFEQRRGCFRPSQRYSRRALVTANTHDLAPLAGFLEGRDLSLRRQVGHIASDEDLRSLQRQRERQREALRRRLAREGLLYPDPFSISSERFATAVTAFLCRTPAPLVGLSLDDLVGETEPVNLPGIAADRHPSWKRRMRIPLEQLASDPRALGSLHAVPSERRIFKRRQGRTE
jgi:4-alpha-glucanotransferase